MQHNKSHQVYTLWLINRHIVFLGFQFLVRVKKNCVIPHEKTRKIREIFHPIFFGKMASNFQLLKAENFSFFFLSCFPREKFLIIEFLFFSFLTRKRYAYSLTLHLILGKIGSKCGRFYCRQLRFLNCHEAIQGQDHLLCLLH